jgi:hypothetical protein
MEGRENELNAPRRDSVLLWTSIVAGPVIWALHMQMRYSMVQWACDTGREAMLMIPAVVAMLLVIASAVLAWRMLRQIDATFTTEELNTWPQLDRRRFMAICGVGISLMSLLLIIAQTIPGFIVGACDA